MMQSKIVKHFAALILVLLLSVSTLAGCGLLDALSSQSSSTVSSQSSGQAISNGSESASQTDDIDTLETDAIDLAALTSYGKPFVVAVGATWCGPCKSFQPTLEAVHDTFVGRVIIKHIEADINPAIEDVVPIIAYPSQYFYNADGTPYEPSTTALSDQFEYIKDKSGNLQFTRHIGGFDEEVFTLILEDMLK